MPPWTTWTVHSWTRVGLVPVGYHFQAEKGGCIHRQTLPDASTDSGMQASGFKIHCSASSLFAAKRLQDIKSFRTSSRLRALCAARIVLRAYSG